ncbi:MAG: FHA domain-containing protein, partial [Akkermansia sp.]|nr:FHA domain-containing protein [Akkermansia sp.]
MLSLTIINSDNICSSFPLEPTPGSVYRIGRSTDCEIALPEEIHLSRVHCLLTVGEGCALLTDNNSSNGIFEDDARVQEILMLPGKQYRAGNCKLMLEYTADAPAEDYQEPAVYEQPTPVYEEEPAAVYEQPAPVYEEEPPAIQPVESPAPVEFPTPQPIELEPEPVVEPTPKPEEEPQPAPAPPLQTEAPIANTPPPPAKPRRKFVAPPPRKPLVKRPTPRPFYTAAGK